MNEFAMQFLFLLGNIKIMQMKMNITSHNWTLNLESLYSKTVGENEISFLLLSLENEFEAFE